MRRSIVFVLAWIAPTIALAASDPSPPPDLAKKAWAISEAVLDRHLDPPTRQQLFLGGIKAAYKTAGAEVPPGLGRLASEASSVEGLAATLAATWPRPKDGTPDDAAVAAAFVDGMLAEVPGEASFVPPQDIRVMEQMAGNRYVGVHIAVDIDAASKCVRISQVMPDGPAHHAGLKNGDLFEAVEGVDVKGKSIRQVIDRLRGADGTEVAVTMRRPGTKDAIDCRMVRRPLFVPTVTGLKKSGGSGSDLRFDGPGAIGYLKVREILASTPRELREMARRLEAEDTKSLVLDLRGVGGEDAHVAVLLADSLLDRGLIGRVRTVARDPSAPAGMVVKETTYQAEPDALFRGWPIVVLVDERTGGTAEWVAAALKDNGRAQVVGRATSGSGTISSLVTLEEGLGGLRLATTRLVRGVDARPPARRPLTPEQVLAGRLFPARPLATPENVVTPHHAISNRTPTAAGPGFPSRAYGQGQPAEPPEPAKDEAIPLALKVLRGEIQKKG
jgi:carboxyl-terminal processing protease